MTGHLSDLTQACVRNMIDLVIHDTHAIMDQLDCESSMELSLMKRGYDLHVHVEHGYQPITSTYSMGAIYMAMVSLLIGRHLSDKVIIFGDVGNAGSLSSKWSFDERYVRVCGALGYRRVITGPTTPGVTAISDEAKAFAASLHSDGKPLVEIITVHKVLDALPWYFNYPET